MIKFYCRLRGGKRQLVMGMAAVVTVLVALAVGVSIHAAGKVQAAPYVTTVNITALAPSPSYVDQPVTVTVQVAAAEAPTPPTGEVQVKWGQTQECLITLDAAGEGSCQITFSALGTVTLEAIYTGQTGYLPGSSAKLTHQVIDKFHPVVAITANTPNPSIAGRPVTVTGSITSGGPQPTGTLSLYTSASTCEAQDPATAAHRCTAALDAGGQAGCVLTLADAGKYTLCAAYAGDTATYPAVSQPVVQRVSASNTFTTITRVDPSPARLGEASWVYFTVTSPDGSPDGTVSVSGGGGTCSATVVEGRCSLTLTVGGAVDLVAGFAGGGQGELPLQPSQSDPFTLRVKAPPTDILITPGTVEVLSAPGEQVGTLSAVDPNLDDTQTFTLVPGEGDYHNAYFTIQGNELHATGPMPTAAGAIAIRVRATDPDGLSFEKYLLLRETFTRGLPNTGFAAGQVTRLPAQPAEKRYAAMNGLELEIPALGVRTGIVGVLPAGLGWDTTWLGGQAGWLNGTAFPTWEGNSVLAGHNYLASGLPGPFKDLATLKYGDEILIHGFEQTSVYAVRAVETVDPEDTSVLAHEDAPWLTLVTCQSFDETRGEYRWRLVVKAVLVEVR